MRPSLLPFLCAAVILQSAVALAGGNVVVPAPSGPYACPGYDELMPTASEPMSICDQSGKPVTASSKKEFEDIVLKFFYADFAKFIMRKVWASYSIEFLDMPAVSVSGCQTAAAMKQRIGTDGSLQHLGDSVEVNKKLSGCFRRLGLGQRVDDLAITASNYSCHKKVRAPPAGACETANFETLDERSSRRAEQVRLFRTLSGQMRELSAQINKVVGTKDNPVSKISINGKDVGCSPFKNCGALIEHFVECRKPHLMQDFACKDTLPGAGLLENLQTVVDYYDQRTELMSDNLTRHPELGAVLYGQRDGKTTELPAWELATEKNGPEIYEMAAKQARSGKIAMLVQEACDDPDDPEDFAQKVLLSNPNILRDYLARGAGELFSKISCGAMYDALSDARWRQRLDFVLGAGVVALGAAAFVPTGGASTALIVGSAATVAGVGITARDLSRAYTDYRFEKNMHVSCVGDYSRTAAALGSLDEMAGRAVLELGLLPVGFLAFGAFEKVATLRNLYRERAAGDAVLAAHAKELETLEASLNGRTQFMAGSPRAVVGLIDSSDIGVALAQRVDSAILSLGKAGKGATLGDHERVADALIDFLKFKGVKAMKVKKPDGSGFYVRVEEMLGEVAGDWRVMVSGAANKQGRAVELGYDTKYAVKGAQYFSPDRKQLSLDWRSFHTERPSPGDLHELLHWNQNSKRLSLPGNDAGPIYGGMRAETTFYATGADGTSGHLVLTGRNPDGTLNFIQVTSGRKDGGVARVFKMSPDEFRKMNPTVVKANPLDTAAAKGPEMFFNPPKSDPLAGGAYGNFVHHETEAYGLTARAAYSRVDSLEAPRLAIIKTTDPTEIKALATGLNKQYPGRFKVDGTRTELNAQLTSMQAELRSEADSAVTMAEGLARRQQKLLSEADSSLASGKAGVVELAEVDGELRVVLKLDDGAMINMDPGQVRLTAGLKPGQPISPDAMRAMVQQRQAEVTLELAALEKLRLANP